MKTSTRRIRHTALTAGALALASMAAVGPQATAVGPQDRGDTPSRAQTRQIASSTLGTDLQVTLTAVRSASDPYAATVRLATYTQADGRWRLRDQETVGAADGWFWFPLTGSQAVCQFSTASAPPQPIAVSLLITPSIGCSPTHRYHLRDGEIVPG
ncbi:hypothetical protein [Streptomyces sp. SAJ15]|uniref:hypothetical protein n=1 Tax=Streptomyces sp. SAJ15 TaxID=2011095 RepID=UPI001185C570|nr:hypothetical protein [Streptomyces sp. SAJ15]TVL90140.1 hypothetical protein CD790_23680 [Streptomyces sp. SAJ15]